MKTLHRYLLVPALAAASLSTPRLANAEDAPCKFSEPRALKLDLEGATSVVLRVGSNNLKVKASPGTSGALQGKACAVSQDLLKALTLTQQRVGDKLIVSLAEDRPVRVSFGSSYSYLDLAGSVPDNILVQLDVGSGDAWLSGAKAASVDVGSGDAELSDIAGLVTAKVGSGDVKLKGAGGLNLLSVGSGDVHGERITGKVDIGSVGSGDLTLKNVSGGLHLGSLGSGDVEFDEVTGNVDVGSIGSGDLIVNSVRGDLSVHRRGSGDIDQRGVTGTVNVPKEH